MNLPPPPSDEMSLQPPPSEMSVDGGESVVGTNRDHKMSTSSEGSSNGSGSSSGPDFPKLEYQYSTPLSSVPNHIKQAKGLKAVKFLSPADVTPVIPPSSALSKPNLPHCAAGSLPLNMSDLDQISWIKSPLPVPCTPPAPSTPLHTTPQTPFRTPKSVARKQPAKPSDQRILGTPDYLAPELLLRKEHDRGVDWWAVGVCLYEFMTGIPPFNDATPDLVFNNILNLNIEWPEEEEALSPQAVQTIMQFLVLDPGQRADGTSIRSSPLLKDVDWEHILDEEAPFVPQPDNATDTTYFNTRNNMQGLTVSQVDL